MKKALPLISLVALCSFIYLYWKRSSHPPQKEAVQPTVLKKKLIKKEVPKKEPTPLQKVTLRKPSPPVFKKTQSLQRSIPVKTNSSIDEISVHLQDENGNLIITSVTIVDDLVIAHGDIIIGQVKDLDRFVDNANSGKPLILPKPTLWKNGEVPYVIDDNLSNAPEINEAIDLINSRTSLRFKFRDNEKDFVRFKEGPLNCYSPLGKIGGEQVISLSSGCKKSQIIHEMLHTIGLLHEQNREDRDEFISIIWENIDPKNHLQFKKIKNANLDLKKHPFDFKSIMLYNQFAFSQVEGDFSIVRTNGDTYEPNPGTLSAGDLKKINSLYTIDKN
ncbi:MAG: hypothetical protein ACJAT2_000057 [Bacteriovoracaceae bacterium]|jgi:hypothetical protein